MTTLGRGGSGEWRRGGPQLRFRGQVGSQTAVLLPTSAVNNVSSKRIGKPSHGVFSDFCAEGCGYFFTWLSALPWTSVLLLQGMGQSTAGASLWHQGQALLEPSPTALAHVSC